MIVDRNAMFCGLALTRKRKMAAAMDSDPPYGVTTPPPETDLSSSDSVPLPWWADFIDAHELADVIRTQCDEKVLLIDCRSFIEFNQSNIVNSINVCCNKIVKRRLQQNKLNIQDFLSSTCHIEIDDAYTIVVYDGVTTDASALPSDNIVAILGNKCSNAFLRVRVLYGGFLEFQAHHPSLLETKTKAPQQATASLSTPCMSVANIGPTKILPFLFLGSMKDALNAELAKANGITYVLNVSMTCPKPTHIQDGHFLRIPVNDNYSEKLLPYFHEAFQFIDKVRESGGCVLVHCLAGVSRSPTLAIAYIMRCYNMISEDAYRYVKEKRITISPNFNFLGQLLEYEKQMDREDNSNFAGCKRRCIDDLRAELSTPGSPVATPRLPKSLSLDSSMASSRLGKAQSPTTALSRLRFEHCLTAPVHKGSNSPTTAFAKLRFGTITETTSPIPLPSSVHGSEEPDYMQCYSADTIHQNTSATSSPIDGAPRSVSLHVLNSNCNNSNTVTGSRSPSPNSLKPSRPMSLSLTRVDELSSNTVIRPISLGVQVLQDANVEERTASKADELTTRISEATPLIETRGVEVRSASLIPYSPDSFKHPEHADTTPTNDVVLREKTSNRLKPRPKSVALAENSPKERVPTPTTPTADYLSPRTLSKDLDMLLAYGAEARSRSLEDIISVHDNIASGQSAGSMSSAGSHSSLHGSLEIIKVL